MQHSSITFTLVYTLTCCGEDTGKIEIERSMGKGFEKNLNLRWDFEECRENVLGQNRIGSYCRSS